MTPNSTKPLAPPILATPTSTTAARFNPRRRRWTEEAEKELKKIPFFVRGKARGNTEKFARELGLTSITVGTLYDAKAHYGR